MEPFALLELTPIGAALMLGGIVYFSTVGMRILAGASQETKRIKVLLPDRSAGGAAALRSFAVPAPTPSMVGDSALSSGESDSIPLPRPSSAIAVAQSGEPSRNGAYHEMDGPFELYVPLDYADEGEPLDIGGLRREYVVSVVAVTQPDGMKERAPGPLTTIDAGQALCVYGPKANVEAFVEEYGLELRKNPVSFKELFNSAVAGTTEAVVSPRSKLIGKTIRDVGFRESFRVCALALHQRGQTYYKEMADRPLIPGDAILLHATWEHFQQLAATFPELLFTSAVDVETQKPAKTKYAAAIFGVTLFLMFFSSFYYQGAPYNPIPLSVCLMGGALGMVLFRVLSIADAYKAVDWRTVFLLGGLIPLGMAVDNTGTAEWIARGVVNALGDSVTPLVLLIVLSLLANVFCLVISNVGACTLLVPLGISMASKVGIDPRTAAIVVGIGVSNSFILPTHQVNALYMGPGGYRTKDYIKIGGGMSLLYNIILVTMVYFFYA